MFHWKKDQDLRDQAEEYALHYDFRQIFTEDADGLRLLALLLTGDRAIAKRCLVEGLDAEQDNVTFREWAHSWSKKAIIKNAIQAISPSPGQALSSEVDGHRNGHRRPAPVTLAGAVSRLPSFERFVFILALVEGYSVHECSELLGVGAQEITFAKSRAVEQVAHLLPIEESPQLPPPSRPEHEKVA